MDDREEYGEYKKTYYHLFNAVTDALALLRRMELAPAVDRLMAAQQETEEMFLSGGALDNPGER